MGVSNKKTAEEFVDQELGTLTQEMTEPSTATKYAIRAGIGTVIGMAIYAGIKKLLS
jgi:hypothetical protein